MPRRLRSPRAAHHRRPLPTSARRQPCFHRALARHLLRPPRVRRYHPAPLRQRRPSQLPSQAATPTSHRRTRARSIRPCRGISLLGTLCRSMASAPTWACHSRRCAISNIRARCRCMVKWRRSHSTTMAISFSNIYTCRTCNRCSTISTPSHCHCSNNPINSNNPYRHHNRSVRHRSSPITNRCSMRLTRAAHSISRCGRQVNSTPLLCFRSQALCHRVCKIYMKEDYALPPCQMLRPRIRPLLTDKVAAGQLLVIGRTALCRRRQQRPPRSHSRRRRRRRRTMHRAAMDLRNANMFARILDAQRRLTADTI